MFIKGILTKFVLVAFLFGFSSEIDAQFWKKKKKQTTKKAPKPKRASIPKNIDYESITLETALSMLALPREIGPHPVTGKMITANNGRFGPYVKHENTFASVKDDNEDILTIGINRAVDLIVEKESKPPSKRRFTRKKSKK